MFTTHDIYSIQSNQCTFGQLNVFGNTYFFYFTFKTFAVLFLKLIRLKYFSCALISPESLYVFLLVFISAFFCHYSKKICRSQFCKPCSKKLKLTQYFQQTCETSKLHFSYNFSAFQFNQHSNALPKFPDTVYCFLIQKYKIFTSLLIFC